MHLSSSCTGAGQSRIRGKGAGMRTPRSLSFGRTDTDETSLSVFYNSVAALLFFEMDGLGELALPVIIPSGSLTRLLDCHI